MNVIFRRYISPFICLVCFFGIFMLMVAYVYDGWPVAVSGIICGVIAILAIPYWVFCDVLTVLKYTKVATKAYQEGTISGDEFLNTAGMFAADVSGVPDLVVDIVVRNVKRKLNITT